MIREHENRQWRFPCAKCGRRRHTPPFSVPWTQANTCWTVLRTCSNICETCERLRFPQFSTWIYLGWRLASCFYIFDESVLVRSPGHCRCKTEKGNYRAGIVPRVSYDNLVLIGSTELRDRLAYDLFCTFLCAFTSNISLSYIMYLAFFYFVLLFLVSHLYPCSFLADLFSGIFTLVLILPLF